MFISNVTVCLQVEKFLSGRLEAGLKSWTECLKGSRTSRHMTMDDSDTSMMAHKPGGDPDIQVILVKTYFSMKLHCIQLFTEGSVAEWSACWTLNPAVLGSSPALATCWICSRLSQF